MGRRSTPLAQSRKVMRSRPTRPLPSRNGWMVSNWAWTSAARTRIGSGPVLPRSQRSHRWLREPGLAARDHRRGAQPHLPVRPLRGDLRRAEAVTATLFFRLLW